MTIDAKIERQIVIGMIISTEFLQGIAPIYKDQLQVSFTRKIARWCLDYYEHYAVCPSKHIEDIFKKQKKKLKDEEADLIEQLLSSLSKKYVEDNGKFNVPYILDSAEEYFRILAIEKLKDGITSSLQSGTVIKAENLVKSFERTARPDTKGVDPFDIQTAVNALSEDISDRMFTFPGELGKVVGVLEREYLMSFFGTRGKGKTWWLLWTAMLGVMHGYNVVLVSLEMSEKQLVRRVHQYLTGLPLYLQDNEKVLIPRFKDEEDEGELTYFRESTRKLLTGKEAIEKLKDMEEASLIKTKLNMLFYPSGTKTMNDLRAQIHNMEYYDGFVPDIIITDYADKFKSEYKTGDRRHQLENIWNEHKALAQERKCLVVTASQANTARTGKDIGEGSATESMAKEDLCDIILALNQKPEEKRQGVMRVGITKHRHAEYDILKEIYVTQCFKIGRPYLDSRVKNN